jgi:hypothetical protein
MQQQTLNGTGLTSLKSTLATGSVNGYDKKKGAAIHVDVGRVALLPNSR